MHLVCQVESALLIKDMVGGEQGGVPLVEDVPEGGVGYWGYKEVLKDSVC